MAVDNVEKRVPNIPSHPLIAFKPKYAIIKGHNINYSMEKEEIIIGKICLTLYYPPLEISSLDI